MREGLSAPDFSTHDQDGNPVRLNDFRGRAVVLFFYPRASTPGCTIEAREFRDSYAQFQKLGVTVLGASPDTVKAQKKFALKEELPFPLLADESRQIAALYGLLKEKNMYGRKVIGLVRTTLLLSPEGVIRHIFSPVKPDGHAQEVLRELQVLGLAAAPPQP